jgi:hypothetical protein
MAAAKPSIPTAPAPAPLVGANRTAASSIVQMWRTNPTGGAGVEPSTLSGSYNENSPAGRTIASIQKALDKTGQRLQLVEARTDKADAATDELRTKITALERDNAFLKRELEAANKQVEQTTIGIERERGRVLDVMEQLRYLTAQIHQWHNEQLTPAQASYWALAGWVYIPLLYVIRGMWFVLYPIFATFTHMTLFGYNAEEHDHRSFFESMEGTQHYDNSGTDAPKGSLGGSGGATKRAMASRPGSLLEKLREGTIAGADKLNAEVAKRREEAASRPRVRLSAATQIIVSSPSQTPSSSPSMPPTSLPPDQAAFGSVEMPMARNEIGAPLERVMSSVAAAHLTAKKDKAP